MRALAGMCLIGAALLAGCADDAAMPAGTTGPSGSPANGLALPEWRLRDWWTYSVAGGERATYVVAADSGTDWTVDTDSPERAFANARDDISRLGPQRKSDLAGSQGDDRVRFFDWPIAQGRSWRTTWDGVALDIKVVHADDRVAHFEARDAAGGLVYLYTYDAAARWFSQIRHLAPDGADMVRLDLVDHGRDWTGTVVRWTLEPGPAKAAPLPIADVIEFPIGDGVTDVWLRANATCSPAGVYSFSLAPQEGGGNDLQGACTSLDSEGVFVDAPRAGDWGWTATVAGQGTVDYEVLLRTRQDVQVG